MFKKRLEEHKKELKHLYDSLYQGELYEEFIETLSTLWKERDKELLSLDNERLSNPFWYQEASQAGMMLYLDNFFDSLSDTDHHLAYLEELGITYLHIMPLFKMPPLLNDGGYAVSDFNKIDPRFGTDSDFDNFIKACRERGISLCLDFVLNHTSDEHEWAERAKRGEAKYQDYYFTFSDRTMVDAYEESVTEVFPVTAPGNFTYCEAMERWVLTTFNNYQWDLNYQNPHLFLEMITILLKWANRGIEVFRFDAIPYIWKEWGTNSRNLPQVHTLMRLFRLTLEIAAPATIIKGEVVMPPANVTPYFGTPLAPESHLLYNFTFMVELWNSLAIGDSRPLKSLIKKIPHNLPRGASWVNCVRCHDDIGWGFDEDVAREMGFDPFSHRQFLIKFFEGSFEGSYSRGELYEADPFTLDARNSGTCASLCGLERATTEKEKELAVKRVLLLHAICFLFSGLAVIYSGDEIGQLNDYSYHEDPSKGDDSRFLHRGKFDWSVAHQRGDLSLPSSQIFHGLKRLLEVVKNEPALSYPNTIVPLSGVDNSLLALSIEAQGETLLFLANLSGEAQRYNSQPFTSSIINSIKVEGDSIVVAPYAYHLFKIT